MAAATDLSAINDALDDLGAMLTHHGEILTQLEQRPVPDITSLARRLEDIADAVDRLVAPPVSPRRGFAPWRTRILVLVAMGVGWVACWSTVRWVPASFLPPGFSRVAPVPLQQKGRF